MYRSVSSTRVADEYFKTTSAPASSSKVSPVRAALALDIADHDIDDLPHLYDAPLSEMTDKKEKARLKFAKNAVHIIPFVLLLCAFILWFFSNPDVDFPMKGDSIAARIEGLTLEGDIDSDGTQRGTVLQDLDLGDVLVRHHSAQQVDGDGDLRRPRNLRKKSLI